MSPVGSPSLSPQQSSTHGNHPGLLEENSYCIIHVEYQSLKGHPEISDVPEESTVIEIECILINYCLSGSGPESFTASGSRESCSLMS